MIARHPTVVVGVDAGPGTDLALAWAAADARTRHANLRLVCAYQSALAYPQLPMAADAPRVDELRARRLAEQVLGQAADRVATLEPGLAVQAEALDGEPVPVLLAESSRAQVLVLGSGQRATVASVLLGSVGAAVAARAHCPAVVLRGPAGLAGENPAVVVGVDATEASQTVLEFGFDHAARHGRPLRAVFCWHPDPLAVMMWRPAPPAPARADAWLAETLAGWSEKYPEVLVHSAVVRELPAAGLVAESRAQDLLVVGSRGRHARAGTLLGSVSQGVLHHASCPVAIVPTPGS